MPTGYTAKLHDGKPQTFEEFALEAARAMGAAIMQRDDAPGPIVEVEPSTYELEALARDEARLTELRSFTEDDWKAEEKRTRFDTARINRKSIQKASERRVRYEIMLAQVEAWRPPTSEHEGLKKFMVEQLTSSIEFDCSIRHLTIPPVRAWQEYRTVQLATAENAVERSKGYLAESIERYESRNKWVRDLRDSLSAPVGVVSGDTQ